MIKGREFLRAFEYLNGMADEVGARSQTSRAYYAAFLEARTFCELHLGYINRKSGREHGEVPHVLAMLDSNTADSLVFLRRLRNMADYDLDISTTTTIAEQARQSGASAQFIIDRLDRLMLEKQATEREPSDIPEPESP